MFLNKNYVIVLITSLLRHSGVTRGVHEKSGGFVNAGGWGTRKLAYTFHAASTRRDKNTRLAWNVYGTEGLTLLTCFLIMSRGNVTFKCLRTRCHKLYLHVFNVYERFAKVHITICIGEINTSDGKLYQHISTSASKLSAEISQNVLEIDTLKAKQKDLEVKIHQQEEMIYKLNQENSDFKFKFESLENLILRLQENNDRGLGINEINISSVMAPISNVPLNKSNKSNITLAKSDSLSPLKSPVNLNVNTESLSDSIQRGPEINVANTAGKTTSCNDVQPDNSQVINTSSRNNGTPSSFKTPARLNKNNTSPMIIEIPSSKQIPRNSHNDYLNKPKTLIQQSNKNQGSSSKSQTIPLKNGETPPKRYTPCPFLRRRGWCAKGNRCDFMHPKPVHHNYHPATPYPFLQGDGFPPIGNFYIPRNGLYHETYNQVPPYSSPFLSHRRRPMTPVPLMDILVQPPPMPFPRHY